jgi:hypothetical protein
MAGSGLAAAGATFVHADLTGYAQAGPSGTRVSCVSPADAGLPPYANWIDARTFGAVGDATTDSTAALQAAIDAAIQQAAPLFLPAGRYRVSSTLNIANAPGFVLLGHGGPDAFLGNGTLLNWKGPANVPLLQIRNVDGGRFQSFTVKSDPSSPLLRGVQIENSGSPTALKSSSFVKVTVDGTNAGGLTHAAFRHLPGGGGASNDVATYINCEVSNYDNAAWLFQSAQGAAHLFLGCTARVNFGHGKVGVSLGFDPSTGAESGGGGFEWYGGGMSGNAVSDFYVADPDGPVTIEGLNSENAA